MTAKRFKELKKQAQNEGFKDNMIQDIINEQAQLYLDCDIKTDEWEEITDDQRNKIIQAYYKGVKKRI